MHFGGHPESRGHADPGFAPGCAYTGNVAANPRLGIPPLNMNDGPQGFRDPSST